MSKYIFEKDKMTIRLNRLPKEHQDLIKGTFEYEDMLIVYAEFYPVCVLDLLKMNYYQYSEIVSEGSESQDDMAEFDGFIDHLVADVFKEYGFGPAVISEGPWEMVYSTDFKRDYVYDKWFRFVVVKEKRYTLNPLYRKKNSTEPWYFIVNDKRLRTLDALESEVRIWLEKLKKLTD